MAEQGRVFVPVTAQAFSWFEDGEKSFELRRNYGQYRHDRLNQGRRVEIRRGYSGESLWGQIGTVISGQSLRKILKEVDYRKIIPTAEDLDEAEEIAESFVGRQGPFVLFEIVRQEDSA